MTQIAKEVAKKEVEEWVDTLGIRPHKLDKIAAHQKELELLVSHGIVRFDGNKVIYTLEEEFEDGRKEIEMVKKRYTVSEVHNMKKELEGDENEIALTMIGRMCSPVVPEGYMKTLKGDFHDLNSISAFFLPI